MHRNLLSKIRGPGVPQGARLQSPLASFQMRHLQLVLRAYSGWRTMQVDGGREVELDMTTWMRTFARDGKILRSDKCLP